MNPGKGFNPIRLPFAGKMEFADSTISYNPKTLTKSV